MRYFESKQIHSCFASMSSDDAFVRREICRKVYLAEAGDKTVSRKYGFSLVYTDADKKYYDQGLHGRPMLSRAPKDEFDAYVQTTYLAHGWTLKDDFLTPALASLYADEDAAYLAKRIKDGYVIPKWSNDLLPDAYQGGFSNEVFRHPALYDYIKGGGCHGFIGHAVRKPKLDAYFEKQWLKADSDISLFAMWLTSTGGRHFGDSLEGSTFAEQQAYIKKSLDGLIAQAQRYRCEDAA